jgi:molecular chaperone DnaK
VARATIDFGIDLGTTNSSIALLRGTNVEVFKNNENSEITPSAVWIDRDGALYVGQKAKDRLEDDLGNAFSEFKLQMGTTQECRFQRDGRMMRPEDLSAEVLKSLKDDVKQRTNEDLNAAVITVPAAFELPQCEATKKAAQLAGLSVSPLVQEPVAAAIAYGFQSESDKVFWLVYDFGGGTFDAAVIQVRDGLIQVINHAGDNHLGGKLLDWEIVEQLVVPALVKEYQLSDFRRSNPKWRGAFAKLKLNAEEAKIQVSRRESAKVIIEYLCLDDRGQPVSLEYDLKRADVQRIAEPFIVRSINISKKVLAERNLKVGSIEKLLLVGGPTLMPYLRERLADGRDGLGIPLEFSVDPLTVVARGAAIFAGTQRLEQEVKPEPGQFAVSLDYKPIGSDPEPLVGGTVRAGSNNNLSAFTIEFINDAVRPQWRSGKIGLSPDGRFVATLWAQKNPPTNTFLIQLCDASGTIISVTPNRFSYTLGLVPTDPPLIHSVGVAMASNEMRLVFEKGTPLPARKRTSFRTAVEVRRGQVADLKIPVVEGDNVRRADRNRLIGSLVIPADQLPRDLPLGTELELVIEIDKSRLVRTSAYIPLLDQDFEHVIPLIKKLPESDQLKKSVDDAKQRLEKSRARADATRDPRAQEVLYRVDRERMVHDVDAALVASQGDRDAADKCEKRVLDLNEAVDQVEDLLEWPVLLKETEEALTDAKKIISQYGNSADKQALAAFEKEIREAIEAHDPDLLRARASELSILHFRVLREQPGWWVGLLNHLETMKKDMTDSSEADQWLAQARRAINNNDVPALKTAVQQLMGLLPRGQQQDIERGFGSGVRG